MINPIMDVRPVDVVQNTDSFSDGKGAAYPAMLP